MKTSLGYLLGALLAVTFISTALPANAYVSVKGYYRSNGTYVAPYVRSNPNGLKYDNYSWKPSQGLYNSTYGTRGTYWDTPTYITDPNYYEGQALYQSGSAGIGSTYIPPTPSYQTVYGGYRSSGILFCNTGYYEKNDSCIAAPAHSTAFGSYSFYCDVGYYQQGDGCVQNTPTYSNAYISTCPINSHTSPSDSTKCVCDSGYEINALKTGCVLSTSNIPTTETLTNNQTCVTTYGYYSVWAGTKNSNGGLVCTCQSGYNWNANQTACVSVLNQQPQTDYKTQGENYYRTSKTCIGLTGDAYSYCITYAYNH